MERFRNVRLSFTFGRTKTEVFEYANVIHYILLELHRISIVGFSVFMWTGEIDLSTLHADVYFFEKKENNLLFRKYVDKFGEGLTGDCRNLVYTVYALRTSHAKNFYLLDPPIYNDITSNVRYIFRLFFSVTVFLSQKRSVRDEFRDAPWPFLYIPTMTP